MEIFVYSYFPPLARHQAGGVQRITHDLLVGFVESGASVTVLCPEHNDDDLLNFGTRLRVLPLLKETDQRPLYPYEQQQNLQYLELALRDADVIWSIDRRFPLEVPQPVVLSLNNFSYATETDSLFSFCWDTLVVPSDYLLRVTQAVAGEEFWEGTPPVISLIPYGIDTSFFRHTDPSELYKDLGIPENDSYIVFPHRPDPNKGFEMALNMLAKLNRNSRRYKLLVPNNPQSVRSVRNSEQDFITAVKERAAHLGINEDIIFHPWVPLDQLPAYYSLASCCLVLSLLPEGFGLTPIEAISCGTPVISTVSGALGDLMPPDHGLEYIGFGEGDAVLQALERRVSDSALDRGRRFIEANYGLDRFVSSYLDCFASARKVNARYNPNPTIPRRLTPWCRALSDSSIWHDYQMQRITLTSADRARLGNDGGPRNQNTHDKKSRERLLSAGIICANVTIEGSPKD